MTADIDPQNFFFKGKHFLFVVFTYIRQADLKLFFLFFSHKIKETHLTGQTVFPFLCHLIHERDIDHHKLAPGRSKAIQCPCLDEVFNDAFIQIFSRHPFHEILDGLERTVLLPFF